jgi:hypothetical protein
MAMYNDFSEIHLFVKNKALFHITHNDYIEESSPNIYKLVDNHKNITDLELENEKYPFSLFWLEFSVGIEYLSKAVLIKHEVDIFSKKTGQGDTIFHKLSGTTRTKDEYEKGWLISTKNNNWLSTILENKGIKYVKQLNTGTLGNIYNGKVQILKNRNIINDSEMKELNYSLRMLANHRRNNDSHFYFKQNSFMDNSDIIKIYIPLINLLLDVYNR